MDKKKKILIGIIVGIFVIGVFGIIGENNEEPIVNNEESKEVEEVEKDEELESIFPDNEKINKILNKYNSVYPDEKITSDIIKSGTQMGRGGNSVIHFTYMDFFIQIWQDGDIYIQGYQSQKTNEDYKDMYIRFMCVYDYNYSNEELSNQWDKLLNDYSYSEINDKISVDINQNNGKVSYFKISKSNY